MSAKSSTPISVPFILEVDGEVIVNHGWIEAKGRNVAAIAFDLTTKYAEILATSYSFNENNAPGVMLIAGNDTLNINKKKRGDATHIVFPEYTNWKVHCASISSYTLNICLIKFNSHL